MELSMAHSFHLYFLGKAQGLYLAADTLPALIKKARAAVADCPADYREFIDSALPHIRAAARKGYAAFASEHGARGIQWRPQLPDEFALRLNRDCAEFGQFPGLDYSQGESLQ